MPRFSVIVPAYQVQAYLHESLRSVLAQSCTDLELIAVDDHSPDDSPRIIDECAAADPRVRPLHLPSNVGLGGARNAGVEAARGEYLVFLDADDTLTPGALGAIADRLTATGDPDVLVYDFALAHWHGELAPNPRTALLAPGEGPEVSTLADRPELLRLLPVVWNKAYRRDFVAHQGLAFPPGYYEDTVWTYPALLAAESIATLDRVCVHYRQRRDGSIVHTASRRHFDVFAQYERIFDFLDARPWLDRWRPALYRRMLDHLTTIATAPSRLPQTLRAEFFARSRRYCRIHHPRTSRPPAGGRGKPLPAGGSRRTAVRHLLMRSGSHRLFRTLHRADRAAAATRTRSRSAADLAKRAALLLYYAAQRRRPLDPHLAVFSAYWARGYACNPAAIEAKARALAPGLRTAWVAPRAYAHTLPPGVRRLEPGSAPYWRALARATYLVNNVNFPARYAKRPGQVHLQTHHGTPLKRMGLDLQQYPAAARGMDFRRLLVHADRWDFSLSANRHSTLAWERAYPAAFTPLEFGYPRNDVLLTAGPEEVLAARAALGLPEDAIAVLYAPTHRDHLHDAPYPLDPARLARLLGPGHVLLVRAHYFHTPPGTSTGAGRLVDVSAHPSTEELYLASDALVTDYSSALFDYAVLDRPLVVHAPDWEVYRATRGVYFDLLDAPPGHVTRDEDELAAVFTTGAWCDAESARRRAGFRARFCTHDDGYAAERTVRHVLLGEPLDALPPLVPPAERRPAPSPAEARRILRDREAPPPVGTRAAD